MDKKQTAAKKVSLKCEEKRFLEKIRRQLVINVLSSSDYGKCLEPHSSLSNSRKKRAPSSAGGGTWGSHASIYD